MIETKERDEREGEGPLFPWHPASLANDLIPRVAYNIRMGQRLARVYAYHGLWSILHDDGSEIKRLSLEDLCQHLRAVEAMPL